VHSHLHPSCPHHLNSLTNAKSDLTIRIRGRFDQLKAKIDKLTRAFEKIPMFNQPQISPQNSPKLLVEGSGCRKWVVYKSDWANKYEERRRGNTNNFTLTIESEIREVV